jgi:O-antigen/teichoic acid export membrane protein
MLDATGMQKTVFKAIFAGTLLNVTLNVALVPQYGMAAAAYATIAGQLVFLVVPGLACLKQGFKPSIGARNIFALAAATAALIVAIYLTADFTTAPRIVLTLAAYTIAYTLAGGMNGILHWKPNTAED